MLFRWRLLLSLPRSLLEGSYTRCLQAHGPARVWFWGRIDAGTTPTSDANVGDARPSSGDDPRGRARLDGGSPERESFVDGFTGGETADTLLFLMNYRLKPVPLVDSTQYLNGLEPLLLSHRQEGQKSEGMSEGEVSCAVTRCSPICWQPASAARNRERRRQSHGHT